MQIQVSPRSPAPPRAGAVRARAREGVSPRRRWTGAASLAALLALAGAML
jgi:hypothetical protein